MKERFQKKMAKCDIGESFLKGSTTEFLHFSKLEIKRQRFDFAFSVINATAVSVLVFTVFWKSKIVEKNPRFYKFCLDIPKNQRTDPFRNFCTQSW